MTSLQDILLLALQCLRLIWNGAETIDTNVDSLHLNCHVNWVKKFRRHFFESTAQLFHHSVMLCDWAWQQTSRKVSSLFLLYFVYHISDQYWALLHYCHYAVHFHRTQSVYMWWRGQEGWLEDKCNRAQCPVHGCIHCVVLRIPHAMSKDWEATGSRWCSLQNRNCGNNMRVYMICKEEISSSFHFPFL